MFMALFYIAQGLLFYLYLELTKDFRFTDYPKMGGRELVEEYSRRAMSGHIFSLVVIFGLISLIPARLVYVGSKYIGSIVSTATNLILWYVFMIVYSYSGLTYLSIF